MLNRFFWFKEFEQIFRFVDAKVVADLNFIFLF